MSDKKHTQEKCFYRTNNTINSNILMKNTGIFPGIDLFIY